MSENDAIIPYYEFYHDDKEYVNAFKFINTIDITNDLCDFKDSSELYNLFRYLEEKYEKDYIEFSKNEYESIFNAISLCEFEEYLTLKYGKRFQSWQETHFCFR